MHIYIYIYIHICIYDICIYVMSLSGMANLGFRRKKVLQAHGISVRALFPLHVRRVLYFPCACSLMSLEK